MNDNEVLNFAQRYTAAWCSQNAASVAAFFSTDGSLSVNDQPPAVGRTAITAVAQSFMTAFPDLCVTMDQLLPRGDRTEYHWTLTGANIAPGGTGNRVRISGYELWNIGEDGLIASSEGHFDSAEYQRQLEHGAQEPGQARSSNNQVHSYGGKMRDQVIRTVETYIDAAQRRLNASAFPLHPDIVFEGPLNTIRGIAEFEEGLKPFYAILKSINLLHLTADDSTCAAVLEIDTIFGLVPFLEYFHVKDGKILTIRAYFDPRPILEGRAKTSAS